MESVWDAQCVYAGKAQARRRHGGGPAGRWPPCSPWREGARVTLLERNESSKKLYITGKGRCNVTNAAQERIFYQTPPQPAFSPPRSAFYRLKAQDVLRS